MKKVNCILSYVDPSRGVACIKTISIISMCLFFYGFALSQDTTQKTLPVNLETVMKLAGVSNLKIAEFNARYELAKANQIEAKERFLPTIAPGFLLMSYSGNAQATDGTFLDVNKNSFWAGAAVTANWDLGNSIYNYLAAKQEVKSADYALQAEKNQQILKAIEAFYDLSAAQSKLIALQNIVKKSGEITKQIEIQVLQGIRYKSDLLLAKAKLNHNLIEINKAEEQMFRKSYELMNLLNIKDDALLMSMDTFFVQVDLTEKMSVTDLKNAQENRPEALRIKNNIDVLDIRKKTVTTGLFIPDVNFGLNDGLFGPYFNPLSNRLAFNFGVKWDIPLGMLFYGGQKKQFDAKLNIEYILLDQTYNTIKQEVSEAQTRVNQAAKQISLAKEALGYARQAFDQSMQRQKLGTALPLEVFQAQEQLLEAEIDHITSVSEYNKAQYALFVAFGNNF